MDPFNEFDIRDSFEAMDQEKTERISMDAFKIICLGLGCPISVYEGLTEQVLKIQDSIDEGLSFKTVKAVLSKVQRDRIQELSKDFSLVDRNGDGSISGEDILALSQQVGDKVSLEEADAIMQQASKNGTFSQSTFAEIFKPPKVGINGKKKEVSLLTGRQA